MLDSPAAPEVLGSLYQPRTPSPHVAEGADRAKIRAVAEEFESHFLSAMLGHMFAGIESDGPFGGGHGEEMFRPLLVQEYGKIMSRSGGIGIADAVERELLRLQEVTS